MVTQDTLKTDILLLERRKAKDEITHLWGIDYGLAVLKKALQAMVFQAQLRRLKKEIEECPEPHTTFKKKGKGNDGT